MLQDIYGAVIGWDDIYGTCSYGVFVEAGGPAGWGPDRNHV